MSNEKNLTFWVKDSIAKKITDAVCSMQNEGLSRTLDAAFFIKKTLPEEIIFALENIGSKGSLHNSIVIHGLFESNDPDVALTIHESVSRYLCGINDIQYRYEDHKAIYPKLEGRMSSEWGNGVGEISPHCDDLYENIDSDLLSLTVVKDNTLCPTLIYNSNELVDSLSEESQALLKVAPVRYRSGRNVVGEKIERIRPVIEQNGDDVLYNIDFRVERNYGDRMVAVDIENQSLIDQLRSNLNHVKPVSADGKPGTFLVINNRKVLHSREKIPKEQTFSKPEESDRLLFRSKGQKAILKSISSLG